MKVHFYLLGFFAIIALLILLDRLFYVIFLGLDRYIMFPNDIFISILVQLFVTGRYWSNLADKVWDRNCVHAINLSSVMELIDINQNTFIIWNGNVKTKTRKIYYYEDKSPESEREIFVSSKASLDYIYFKRNNFKYHLYVRCKLL